ncbi:MAG: 30S ribosome-binding factor RbfA [Burkholderiales bacterium]|jgi:ribosome-binding factor A|nr:30S ribosome-binding factor RbfA [Burkholderiales bacterium]
MKKRLSARSHRIGDQIQRELAELLREQIKDPRIGLVTITAVDVSNDLSHAKVYFTNMSDAAGAEDAEQVLARTAGFLRSEIAHRLSSFTVPQLHFIYDRSTEHGMEMSRLIAEAVGRDQKPDS